MFFWKSFFPLLGWFLFLPLVIVTFVPYLILKLGQENEPIQVDRLRWSLANIEKHSFLGFISILTYDILCLSDFGMLKNPQCMIDSIIAGQSLNDPFLLSCLVPGFDFPFLLIHFLIMCLLYGFLAGFKPIEIEQKSTPNQGIKLSIRNALIYSFVMGLMGGIGGGPFMAMFAGLRGGIAWGVIIGLCCGLLGGAYHGGAKAIQHLALHIVLSLNQCLPWNYEAFLEQAVQMKILQQVGGRYSFIHGLLRTHLVRPMEEIDMP
jgi:hypothetical protein